jgi:hypothetical protein
VPRSRRLPITTAAVMSRAGNGTSRTTNLLEQELVRQAAQPLLSGHGAVTPAGALTRI